VVYFAVGLPWRLNRLRLHQMLLEHGNIDHRCAVKGKTCIHITTKILCRPVTFVVVGAKLIRVCCVTVASAAAVVVPYLLDKASTLPNRLPLTPIKVAAVAIAAARSRTRRRSTHGVLRLLRLSCPGVGPITVAAFKTAKCQFHPAASRWWYRIVVFWHTDGLTRLPARLPPSI